MPRIPDEKAQAEAAKQIAKQEALAQAAASTAAPHLIAADLLNQAFSGTAYKRFETAVVDADGNPVLQNGATPIFSKPDGLTSDMRRAALYLQLLRIVGKSAGAKSSHAKRTAAQKQAVDAIVTAMKQNPPGTVVTPSVNASGSLTL